LTSICGAVNIETSDITDIFERPNTLRWKWNPKGFVRVNRKSISDSNTGECLRKQFDQIIEGPYFEAGKIASVLFPIDGKSSDLNSFESIFEAIKRNYGMVDQERIWIRMAKNLTEWKYGKEFSYPFEITQYFLLDDK
jgi:hypothetical protein